MMAGLTNMQQRMASGEKKEAIERRDGREGMDMGGGDRSQEASQGGERER